MPTPHDITWDADRTSTPETLTVVAAATNKTRRFWTATLLTNLFLLITLLAGCVMPPAMTSVGTRTVPVATALSSAQAEQEESAPRLQPYLQNLAIVEPEDSVQVIVQYQGDVADFTQLVTAADGSILNELAMINAMVVSVSAGKLPTLAEQDAVRWIALDAPVRKSSATDGSAYNARDDFDQIAYNGSTGALDWSMDWAEIGEADGPATGNVMVTSFWGGALQGLRLRNPQTGVMRSVDLGVVQNASLGLAYRRKDFASEKDYVTIEFSQDGGTTWQEAARLSGPTTDSAIQYGDFDLPLVSQDKNASERLFIRFLTAPSMSSNASFYVDAVDVRVKWETISQASNANQIYLPMVAGGGAAQETAQTASRSKPEVLAEVNAAQSNGGCSYNCIDLDVLQSTYAKSTGATNLWNESPYIRGWNVTVAVVDSGISPHPDLNDYNGNSRILTHVNFVANSAVPDDFYGHGTHVAGTIGGLGISSSGVYMGVAPEARFVDVKVTDDYGMGNTSDVVAGLQWIYENRNNYNIKVANLSLNSTVPESYHVSALDAALEVLWFNKITVVVSAGNQGKEKLYPPANDPFAIVVGSVDDKGTVDISDDKLSKFSAYGMTSDGFVKPDIVAPGQNIISLLASDDMNLTRILPLQSILGANNRYFKMSGTSMASAVVAGAVALLVEDEPSLTPDQVKYRLMSTAKPFNVSEGYCATGAGYLDIQAAVHGNSTQSANTGIQASQLLWSGANPVTWGSVSWNSVSWNSVSWNSVSWNSVSWNSVSWNSVSWNSNSSGTGSSSGDCGTAFKSFTVIKSQTNQDARPLYNNAIIDLNRVGTDYLTIRADVVGPAESVKFDINNGSYVKVESLEPYALFGDSNGSYAGSRFNPGSYSATITVYPEDSANGETLLAEDFQFYVVSSSFWPRLRSVKSGLCIETPYSSWYLQTGSQYDQELCSWSDRQEFRLKPVDGETDVVTLVDRQYNTCLDVYGARMGDGEDVIQWQCHNGENQQFRLKSAGNGKFQLVAVHSGKCVSVKNGSTWLGAGLVQETCVDGATHQQWRFY